MDGEYQKGLTGTFRNVAPEKHQIRVMAATEGRTLLAAEARVAFEVQAPGETGY